MNTLPRRYKRTTISESIVTYNFISGFNDLYGFVQNIRDIFNGFFSGGGETLQNILNNQRLLNELLRQMGSVKNGIDALLIDSSLTQAQLQQIRNILIHQNESLDNIQSSVDRIESYLHVFMPAIINMLSGLVSISSVILQQSQIIDAKLDFIIRQLEEINANVLLGTVITEFSSVYNDLKYISTRYRELSGKVSDDAPSDDGEIIETSGVSNLINFSKNICGENELRGADYVLKTMHNLLISGGIFSRNSIELINEQLKRIVQAGIDITVPSQYVSFYKNIIHIQLQCYIALIFCQKLLGYDTQETEDFMQSSVEEQINRISDSLTSMNVSQIKYADLLTSRSPQEYVKIVYDREYEPYTIDFSCQPGFAISGIEFKMVDDKYTIIFSQGRLGQEYIFEEDTFTTFEADIGQLLGVFAGGDLAGLDNSWFGNRALSGHVLTGIKIIGSQDSTIRLEVYSSEYNAAEGTISASKVLVSSGSAESEGIVFFIKDNVDKSAEGLPIVSLNDPQNVPFNQFGIVSFDIVHEEVEVIQTHFYIGTCIHEQLKFS